jgi:hypothetical protein
MTSNTVTELIYTGLRSAVKRKRTAKNGAEARDPDRRLTFANPAW